MSGPLSTSNSLIGMALGHAERHKRQTNDPLALKNRLKKILTILPLDQDSYQLYFNHSKYHRWILLG